MIEQNIERYAQLRKEFEDRSSEQSAVLRSQTSEWLEKSAARFWEYQILTACIRMMERSASSQQEGDHNYWRGRMEQALLDLELPNKIMDKLSDPKRGTPTA